jgi:hypothetical protein
MEQQVDDDQNEGRHAEDPGDQVLTHGGNLPLKLATG